MSEVGRETKTTADPAFRNVSRVPVVEAHGVNYHFGQGEGRKQVLYDNNITLYAGEIIIMTGPSGSGKTTLLTLIGALRSLQDGSLKVFRHELKGLASREQEEVRRNIGFIFQAHNLLDSLTAFQNVKLATQLHQYSGDEADKRARTILTELGLGERMNYKPSSLSGGQRQRVAIARALVNRPGLILADEPTAALDKDSGKLVISHFQKLAREEQTTVLIVTHDSRILDVADRIVNMTDGYVVSNVDVNESVTIAQFLRRCEVFKHASPTLLADVAGTVQLERASAGTSVIVQGEKGDKFYIIRQGEARVLREADGSVKTLAELGQGDFFGEMALLKEAPRNATVAALTDMELYTLSKDVFLQVVNSGAGFEEQLKKVFFTRG